MFNICVDPGTTFQSNSFPKDDELHSRRTNQRAHDRFRKAFALMNDVTHVLELEIEINYEEQFSIL